MFKNQIKYFPPLLNKTNKIAEIKESPKIIIKLSLREMNLKNRLGNNNKLRRKKENSSPK